MKKKNKSQRNEEGNPNSSLIRCRKCGGMFWPGSLEERKTVKECIGCRKEKKNERLEI